MALRLLLVPVAGSVRERVCQAVTSAASPAMQLHCRPRRSWAVQWHWLQPALGRRHPQACSAQAALHRECSSQSGCGVLA